MECNKDYRSQTVISTDKDSERNGEAEFWMDIAHANDIELSITKKEFHDYRENLIAFGDEMLNVDLENTPDDVRGVILDFIRKNLELVNFSGGKDEN